MKGAQMKSIAKLSWSALGLAVVGLAAVLGFQDVERGGGPRNTFTVDVAADCRTFVTGPNRADVSYVSGKIFPAGTLPSGISNHAYWPSAERLPPSKALNPELVGPNIGMR